MLGTASHVKALGCDGQVIGILLAGLFKNIILLLTIGSMRFNGVYNCEINNSYHFSVDPL